MCGSWSWIGRRESLAGFGNDMWGYRRMAPDGVRGSWPVRSASPMPRPPKMRPRSRIPRQRAVAQQPATRTQSRWSFGPLPLRTPFPQPCNPGKYARAARHRGLHSSAPTARNGAAARTRPACKPVLSSNHRACPLRCRGKNCAPTAASGQPHRHRPGWPPLARAAPDDRRPPALEACPRALSRRRNLAAFDFPPGSPCTREA